MTAHLDLGASITHRNEFSSIFMAVNFMCDELMAMAATIAKVLWEVCYAVGRKLTDSSDDSRG